MQFGFGRSDITPRIGVELYGYGPFLARHSTAIRERLLARAMAVSDGENTCIIVSCDLVGVAGEVTRRVREKVEAETGIGGENICVHCIHTHSAPRAKYGIGQGAIDLPYYETLPTRIASACIEAVANLQESELRHAAVPCEGLGYNREWDERPSLEEALREDWRPNKPDITDTEAHVLRVDGDSGMRGFFSYFSCHPVVGPSTSGYIHSDFVGVATNMLEREHPGTTGLFMQGCEGNINSCVVFHDEQTSLLALDVLASRYARQIRPGLDDASSIGGNEVRAIVRDCPLSRDPVPRHILEAMLAENEAILRATGVTDEPEEVRRATVWATALRKEIVRQDTGQAFDESVELQAFRIGDLVIVGAPFELMLRYKNRVQAEFDTPVLVLSLCNDTKGYAPERESFAQEGNYAAKMVPYLLGYPPFSVDIEDELVAGMVELVRDILLLPEKR